MSPQPPDIAIVFPDNLLKLVKDLPSYRYGLREDRFSGGYIIVLTTVYDFVDTREIRC